MSDVEFIVVIGGLPLGPRTSKRVESIQIDDKAGTSTDTATITLNDKDGLAAIPENRSPVQIFMGKPLPFLMFSGVVERSTSSGGRQGRKLVVSCAGVDVASKAREPQRCHFDEMTVEAILKSAGGRVGVTEYRIAERFKSLVLDYEAMDNEDLITFGARLAKEVGATFKFRSDTVVFADRHSGLAPSGQPMPIALVARGGNLHTWGVSPQTNQKRFARIIVRYFDRAAAKWDQVEIDTGLDDVGISGVGTYEAPNKEAAERKAKALKTEMLRGLGQGTVTSELLPQSQPEGGLALVGAKLGIDGVYRIDGASHRYDRGSGSRTTSTIKSKVL